MQVGMMSSIKMKSLLKGLRYISQVFAIEGEKEEEMQIGNPTDVKHVAHIGWDGASDNSTAPTWMNEFKGSPGCGEDDSSVKCESEYGGRSRDLPKLPKSTRKSASEKGSPTKEKSDKTKRRSRKTKETSGREEGSSRSQHSVGFPAIPKKSKRKKNKEGNGGSTRSSTTSEVDQMSDFMSDTASVRSMPQFDDDKDGF